MAVIVRAVNRVKKLTSFFDFHGFSVSDNVKDKKKRMFAFVSFLDGILTISKVKTSENNKKLPVYNSK